jgi:hypothetical protein
MRSWRLVAARGGSWRLVAARGVDLVGRQVVLIVSDPWDLASPDGSVRFASDIARALTYADGAEEERLLLSLEAPIEWREGTFRFLVARGRGGRGIAEDLVAGRSAECTFIGQPAERAGGVEPCDMSWWRGGLAGAATLELRP